MLIRYRLPKTLLWVFNLLVIFLLMFTSFRMMTLIAFKPETERWVDTLPAFLLGLRFDLRWISFMLLPIVFVSMKMEWSPFYSSRNKKFWTTILMNVLPVG